MSIIDKDRYCSSKKITTKTISILTVFILLSTTFSSLASSKQPVRDFLDEVNEKLDNDERPVSNLLKNSEERPLLQSLINVKNRIQNMFPKFWNMLNNLKDKFQQLRNRFEDIKSENVDEINSLESESTVFGLLRGLFSLSSISGMVLYTNYDGIEKETSIRIGSSVTVDVDNDGDKDIKARFTFLPSIEKPLVLAINLRLKVDRLSGFDDVKEDFKVYVQFTMPGTVEPGNMNDRIRFGYISEKGEEVPSTCLVTYVYYPYLFYKEKPKHVAKLDPGSIDGKDRLSLLFSYSNYNGSGYVSEDIFEIKSSPAVKSQLRVDGIADSIGKSVNLELSKATTSVITYERHANESVFRSGLIIYKQSSFKFDIKLTPFKKGGGIIEYQRNSSTPLDALLFFEPVNKNSNYFYVYDLPSHIKLSWLPNSNSLIELNTYNEKCSEIGWRNALIDEDVTARVYLKNLPSLIQLNWKGELKEGQLDLITDISGLSAHVYAVDISGNDGYLTADLYSGENFDFSIYWNFSEKMFGISRSNIDLSIDVSIYNIKGSGESANFSCDIENTITSPFEFYFGTLLDGDFDITFTGNIFQIKNLDFDMFLPSVGKFILKMHSFKMDRASSVHFNFSYDNVGGEVSISCQIDVTNGVEILGLIIGFNDFLYPAGDIVTSGNYHHLYSLTFDEGTVRYSFSSDLSNGWVCISGGLILTFESTFEKYGQTIGIISGVVAFNNENDELNISWDPNGINVDGSGVVSLNGFKFWIKDKFDVTISSIVGSFKINTLQKTGELLLNINGASASFDTDFSIDIQNLMDVTVKADFGLDFTLGLSGYVKLSWDQAGMKISSGGVTVGFSGVLSIYDLYFNSMNSTIVSSSSIIIVGDFVVSLSVGGGSVVSYDSQRGASLTINNLDLNLPGFIFTCSKIYLGASGHLLVNVPGDYIEIDVNAGVSIINADISNFGIASITKVSFSTTASLKGFYIRGLFSTLGGNPNLRIDKTASSPIKIDDFYLKIDNPYTLVTWGRLHIMGSGMIEFSDEIKVDASITGAEWTSLQFQTEALNDFFIDGNINLVSAGVLTIKGSAGDTNSVNIILNSGSADIDDFYIRVSGTDASVTASWDTLHIGGSYIDFKLVGKTGSTNSINLILNRGILSFNDFSIVVSSSTGSITGSWDSLYLEGYINFNSIGSKSNGFTIDATGGGLIQIDNAALHASSIDISVEYFKLDLADVSANVELEYSGEDIDITSVSTSGQINELTITKLEIHVDTVLAKNIIKIEKTSVSFSGNGYFSANFDKDGQKTFNVVVETVNENSNINFGYIYLQLWSALTEHPGFRFEFEDITINGNTKLIIDGEIGPISGETDLPKFVDVSLGIDTEKWNIGLLRIGLFYGNKIITAIEFKGITGKGLISLGILDLTNKYEGEDISTFPKLLTIQIDGEFSWQNLNIGPESFSTIGGYFNGNAKLSFNFLMFYWFTFNNGELGIDCYENTVISFSKIQTDDGYVSIADLQLNPGTFSITWDADVLDPFGNGPDRVGNVTIISSGTVKPKFELFKLVKYSRNIDISLASIEPMVPYFKLNWDVSNLEYGYGIGRIGIDTNGQKSGVSVNFLNFIKIAGGFVKAEDFLIEWGKSSPGVGYYYVTHNNVAEFEAKIEILNEWSISGKFPKYLRASWDTNFSSDNYGELKLDTNDELCQINLSLSSIKLYGEFKAQDKVITLTLEGGILNWDLYYSGTWWVNPAFIAIYVLVRSVWWVIMNYMENRALDGRFLPEGIEPFDLRDGDTFKIQAFNSITGEWAIGATVRYYWQNGDYQGQEKITGSYGITGEFTAHIREPGEASSCYIEISHPDYKKTKILNFYVKPNDFYCDAHGPYNEEPGVEFYFTGSAEGGTGDYTWLWNFGDGGTSTERNPGHIYQNEGAYTATLTVTDEANRVRTDIAPVNIAEEDDNPQFDDPAITGPSVVEWNSVSGGTFYAHVTDPEGDPLEYKWKFETSAGIFVQLPLIGWEEDNFWSYGWTADPNTPYTRSVIVQARQQNNLLKVTGWSSPYSVWVTKRPIAEFTKPINGIVGEPVTFDASQSNDPDGSIVSYSWEFGDGSSGSGKIVTHTYNSPNSKYFVRLTVTDDCGLTSCEEKQIQIFYSGPWKSLTFDSDPENFWDNENSACDGNDATYAESNEWLQWSEGWCPYIYFDVPSNYYYFKVKFKAFKHVDYVSAIKIEGSEDGSFSTLYEGTDFPNRAFTEKTFQLRWNIERIRISFKMKSWSLFGLEGPTAELYEIQLQTCHW